MEDVANRLVTHIYNLFRVTPEAPSQASLVRLFKTCSEDELSPDLKQLISSQADPEARYLALLGSCGENDSWNSRMDSRGHKLIPLESAEVVESIPMISNLIRMLGLNLNDVVKPNPDLNIAGFYPLSVFYVEEALDSPYIPAKQEFVVPYGIHSVVGFGGLLTFTDMFTVVMFFKVPVGREQAALFKSLADQVHDLLMPFKNSGQIFNSRSAL